MGNVRGGGEETRIRGTLSSPVHLPASQSRTTRDDFPSAFISNSAPMHSNIPCSRHRPSSQHLKERVKKTSSCRAYICSSLKVKFQALISYCTSINRMITPDSQAPSAGDLQQFCQVGFPVHSTELVTNRSRNSHKRF